MVVVVVLVSKNNVCKVFKAYHKFYGFNIVQSIILNDEKYRAGMFIFIIGFE